MKITDTIADKSGVLTRATDCIRADDFAGAEHILREVLREKPEHPDALHLLGLVAYSLGKYKSAISLIQKAIAYRPGDSRMYGNCGEAYRRLGDIDNACLWLRRALEMDAGNADAWCNYGSALRQLGRVDEAISGYRRALSIQSDHANAHYNLGLALLVKGNFSEGWHEYEYRWKALSHLKPRNCSLPRWNGQNPAGKTIFIYHEQGYGDTLHFVRYLSLLKDMGAKVIFECPSEFHRLFSCLDGISCCSPGNNIGPFDYHVPLLSLPAAFGTTLENIPCSVPYLRAPAESISFWRERISNNRSNFQVGICWAGNPRHINDQNRSCRLSIFSPLSRIEGALFYSLQKGEAAIQSKNPPVGMRIIDFTEELKDWGDTAAMLKTLNLIITVDTAIAHLAGALGCRVWMLLPFDSDWRWLLVRTDSPWYPTMRLFRQPERRKWNAVSNALASAVAETRGAF